MEKQCSVCNLLKPLEQYSNKIRGLYGKDSICKLCKKEKDKLRWLSLKDELSDKRRQYLKDYYIKNREKKLEYNKTIDRREYDRKYQKTRRENNPINVIINRTRSRIYYYLKLKSYPKNDKTFNIVGCTPEFLKEHLECKFINNMSWDNYGEWHIDHIIPLSSSKTKEELIKLFHYTNLQPLWAFDNMSKGNKKPPPL
jgi:hypothetical protein